MTRVWLGRWLRPGGEGPWREGEGVCLRQESSEVLSDAGVSTQPQRWLDPEHPGAYRVPPSQGMMLVTEMLCP